MVDDSKSQSFSIFIVTEKKRTEKSQTRAKLDAEQTFRTSHRVRVKVNEDSALVQHLYSNSYKCSNSPDTHTRVQLSDNFLNTVKLKLNTK